MNSLIKSGGETGSVKPGNLTAVIGGEGAKSCGENPRDEEFCMKFVRLKGFSFKRFCVFIRIKWRYKNGKKIIYV